MTAPQTDPAELAEQDLPDGSLLAAIDLGSNSFHMIVARVEHGEIRPVEALAEKVQLGAGLVDGILDDEAIERGLACLSRFAQALGTIEPQRIRVVGTNALRQADNRRTFCEAARRVLGAPVDVIYGREEARLVYLGVAHTLSDDTHSRLVVDIGGGSTEFIIGERFEPQRMESLQMGCVSYSRRFFPEGRITEAGYRAACQRAQLETSHIRHRYHRRHWAECVGSSGTLNAIAAILLVNGWSDGSITPYGLTQLEQTLLSFDTMDDIQLDGLSEHRRNVIVAGAAIARGLFRELEVESMQVSPGALREGVIYDLLGRLSHEDVRERTIRALMQRYSVDSEVAATVERRATTLYHATRRDWSLGPDDLAMLSWIARTHEIGMAISHKHYNRHSAYLLQHADLPGFSQQEQERLALLAMGHRRKVTEILFAEVAEEDRAHTIKLLTLIRLATLFKYTEQLAMLPDFSVEAGDGYLSLNFPQDWLEQHPLTAQELEQEQGWLSKVGMNLSFC